MSDEPIAEQILPIPQVDHTRIIQPSAIPLIARVKGPFDRPDGIDA
jgi:hypothetical protein